MRVNSKALLEQSLDLVATLYQGAEDADGINALDKLTSLLGSRSAHLYRWDRATGAALDAYTDTDKSNELANSIYLTDWGRHDPHPALSAMQKSGTVLRNHDHFSEKFVASDPYYQEFLIPYGYRWLLGGMVHGHDGTSIVVATIRAEDQGPFEMWAAHLLKALLPHFQRSGSIKHLLGLEGGGAGQSTDGLLQSVPSPCILIDASGRVHAIGQRAAVFLRSCGNPLVVHGKLRFSEPHNQHAWVQALSEVNATALPTQVHLEINGALYRVEVIPWELLRRPRDGRDRRLFLVTVEQREESAFARLARFAANHCLTPAETEILGLLAEGMVVKAIAQQRSCSPFTVRAQLASLMQKTGCHSQREILTKLGKH